MKKYELTTETKTLANGRTLCRIKAFRDFGDVKKGDLGGWIESESCLTHKGDCWVADEAWVQNDAKVLHDAIVSGSAWLNGNVIVSGKARVGGSAWMNGNVKVTGNACIMDGIHSGEKVKS